MGVDRTYGIRIVTVADNTGAADAAGALGKVGQVNEEGSKTAEKHAGQLHQMHKVFHALNEVVPGLGVAMQSAFSPIGATFSAGLLVLHYFREQLHQINEEFSRMEAEAAKPLTTIKESTDKATQAVRMAKIDFNDWLDSLKSKSNEAVSALESEIKKINEAARVLKEIREGKGRDEIEEGAEFKIRKATESALSGALAGKHVAEMNLPGAEAAADDLARKTQIEELSKPASTLSDERRKQVEAEVAKAQKEVDRLSNLFAEAKLRPESEQTGGWDPAVIAAALGGAKQNLREAQQPLDAEKEFQEARRKRLNDLTAEQKQADDELARAKKVLEEWTHQVNNLNERLQEMDTRAEGRRQGVITGAAQSGIPRNLAGFLLSDIEGQETRAHGEAMTAKQAHGNQMLFAVLRQHGANQDEINRLIKEMMDMTVSQSQKITDVYRVLSLHWQVLQRMNAEHGG